LLPAARADAVGDDAAGLLAGALDDEPEAAGGDGDGDEDGELHAASTAVAPHAMTEKATRYRRILLPLTKRTEIGEITVAVFATH
jgi:hypothetical protein